MSFETTAQMFEVKEEAMEEPTVVLYQEKPEEDLVMELHQPQLEPIMEVEVPFDIEIVVDELPGSDGLDEEKERQLEVEEPKTEEKEEDKNDARKSKKPEKWDWESKGASGFVAWVKERIDTVPKHSGYDTAGLERAISYLEKLDSEISKAMRLDLEGDLDADKVEEIRAKIDDGIERLHDRLDKIKKKSRKKKADDSPEGLIKEAATPKVEGIVITVPLLIARIARVCINGTVSGGKDIQDLFQRQAKKYKLSDREQAELIQFLEDMGYPLHSDRGFLPDEEVDLRSSDNFDFSASYQG